MKRCFICSVKDKPPIKSQFSDFSLRCLSRYLTLNKEGDSAQVPFCPKCTSVYTKFMEWFQLWEHLGLELARLVESMTGWMAASGSQDGMDGIRQALIAKCQVKLSKKLPIVSLKRLKPEDIPICASTISAEVASSRSSEVIYLDEDNDDIPVAILELPPVKIEKPDIPNVAPDDEIVIDEIMPLLTSQVECKVEPSLDVSRTTDDESNDPLWEKDDPEVSDAGSVYSPSKKAFKSKSSTKKKVKRRPGRPKKATPLVERNDDNVKKINGVFKCQLCEKEFDQWKKWNLHYQIQHKKRKFGPEGVFRKHCTETEEGKYSCDLCQKEYVNLSGFHAHFRTIHINVRWKCEDCLDTFTQKCTLTKHLITCRKKPKPPPQQNFICKHCKKGFSNPGWLREHTQRVHQGVRFGCKVCKKSYSYKHCLDCHACVGPPSQVQVEDGQNVEKTSPLEPLNRFTCTFCGETFASYIFLRRHRVGIMLKKKLRCYDCTTTITHKCGVKRHEENCKGTLTEIDPDRPGYICEICNKHFSNKTGWTIHKESIHLGMRFNCDLCGQQFTNRTNVLRHRRNCSGVIGVPKKPRKVRVDANPTKKRKPAQCKLCRKKFTSSMGLKGHMNSKHLGIKVKCEVCNNSFSQSGTLLRHRKTTGHGLDKLQKDVKPPPTGRKIFRAKPNAFKNGFWRRANGGIVCNPCGNHFASLKGIVVHHQTFHKGIPHIYECDKCGNSFLKIHGLKTHLKECSKKVKTNQDASSV